MTSSCATIVGVLPLCTSAAVGGRTAPVKPPMSQERVYIPRNSRPHIAWGGSLGDHDSDSEDDHPSDHATHRASFTGKHAKDTTWTLLGRRRGGTFAETHHTNQPTLAARKHDPSHEGEGHRQSHPRHTSYGLCQLVTADTRTGLHALCYRSLAHRVVTTSSTPIPSGRRIVCMQAMQPQLSFVRAAGNQAKDVNRREPEVVSLWVSDDVGNVYVLDLSAPCREEEEGEEEEEAVRVCGSPVHKRARVDSFAQSAAADVQDGYDDTDKVCERHMYGRRSDCAGVMSTWRLLAPSCSALVDNSLHRNGGERGDSTSLRHGRLLSQLTETTTMGAPGWAGLTPLLYHASSLHSFTGVGSAHSNGLPHHPVGVDAAAASLLPSQLVSARQYFHDIRLVDVSSSSVVRTYGSPHSPTGIWQPRGQPHCVLVTAGCLATLYDLRCPSAALTLTEVRQSVAEMRACQEEKASLAATASELGARTSVAKATHTRIELDALMHGGDANQDEYTNHNNGNGTHEQETSRHPDDKDADATAVAQASKHHRAAGAGAAGLVLGRLTSRAGTIADGCNTAREFELALAVDRALQVYDYRKFTRVFTSSAVLKYTIGSVTCAASGRAVVCAGIDSEMRAVGLPVGASRTRSGTGGSSHTHRTASGASSHAAASLPQKADENAVNSSDAFAVSTFRTRLNTSINCQTTWSGGWVSSCNDDGRLAIGISATNELYLVE